MCSVPIEFPRRWDDCQPIDEENVALHVTVPYRNLETLQKSSNFRLSKVRALAVPHPPDRAAGWAASRPRQGATHHQQYMYM